jgi:hypothetical protein
VNQKTGNVTVTANQARVYVEAPKDGTQGITNTAARYD